MFFSELFDDTTIGEKILLIVVWSILIIGILTLLGLFIWLSWDIWFNATHHCARWSAEYWSEDHYGKPILTRDCSEWSR